MDLRRKLLLNGDVLEIYLFLLLHLRVRNVNLNSVLIHRPFILIFLWQTGHVSTIYGSLFCLTLCKELEKPIRILQNRLHMSRNTAPASILFTLCFSIEKIGLCDHSGSFWSAIHIFPLFSVYFSDFILALKVHNLSCSENCGHLARSGFGQFWVNFALGARNGIGSLIYTLSPCLNKNLEAIRDMVCC